MPTRGNEWLSIGRLAERTGLAVSAIRHYESLGLVHAERSEGGQRRFRRADVRRLSFVLIAQRLGFSLAEIRAQLAHLPRSAAPTATDWRRMGKGFRRDIDARIAELERLRDTLDGCIGCGCLSLERCALYNPDDGAAAFGTGPRWLLGDSPDDLERPIDPSASARRRGGAGGLRGATRAASPEKGRRR